MIGKPQRSIAAKKSLGQNFLISPRVVEAIAAAGELRAEDAVIEIGPGKGVLTRALLASGARVVAIEKDDRLVPLLAEEFKQEIAAGWLQVVHGDVLEIMADSSPLPESWQLKAESYKVIANIPYYITGQIVRLFLSAKQKPALMVLMVQKEVAARVIARDGKESILSLSVKAYATPELVMNVSRGNFFPVPNVDSAVIKLTNIQNPFADRAAEDRFFEIVKAGFSQKRKKLISNLEAVMPRAELEARFAALRLDSNVRAEDVPLETWIALASR
ncbi:MAG TPA: 16S rRNA (adenine(1518)-N(6)/adenine(1519)-N(6))-dimethyltransferase RsmA [Candidatus Paceibacterota bacterium]|nr:16S rRNA (adenine(1518)-N(6)/adenine(1519)-N(6))-dimethyltransferase RsmA [Candidatus Paceibacterota bacterium]